MPVPTPYNRLYSLLQYATDHPSAPFDSTKVDAELNAVELTLDEICRNLALLQRDDGAIRNASVHPDSFTTASLALMAGGTWTPRGLWVTATAYAVGDVVQEDTTSYVCATAHTSGTFATDYAAGKWIILGETWGALAAAIACSAYGHVAATNVQDFLEELVDEKAVVNGDSAENFAVADATDETHAASAGQVQTDSLVTANAGGTPDAITATIASGLSVLTDRMRVRIRAAAANTGTAPTFNLTLGSTATGALTIKKGAGTALRAGDIAGAGHMLELAYDAGNTCWLLLNPASAVSIATSELQPGSVENVGLSFSVDSGDLVAALTTAAGSAPTSSDVVRAAMRSSAIGTGTYAAREVTAALGLTVSSGSTLGHASAVQEPLHWYLIDNAGTLELAVSKKFFGYSGIVSTTAEGGAGAADSATVMYSTTARANVAFAWVARSLDTQVTAGTWALVPSTISLVREPTHIQFPGMVVDFAGATVPDGWLENTAAEVAIATYPDLYAAIGTTHNRGDETAGNFRLPDGRGRGRIGRGTGTVTESGVNAGVDTGTDAFTVDANNTKWITGMLVTFTLASGTITGLTSGNPYYVVRASSTTIKLASTLANAQNGTVIDLTAKSTPVWTISHTLTARTLGELGGEEAHAQSSTELLAHTHTQNTSDGGDNFNAGAGIINSTDSQTGSKGGNAAMNVMGPFGVFVSIIKT